MGIGFAAIRDIVAFLRHAGGDNPLGSGIRHALGFGISQSGRVLRDLVYHGFNQDLAGRQVFDGIMPVVAGSRRTCVNWAFAQAGRYSRQHEDHSYGDDQFPFSYPTLNDPISGTNGWHPATRARRRRVPEGGAPGYRKRCLAGAQFAGGHRHQRPRHRNARRRTCIRRDRRATRAVPAAHQTGHAIARQSLGLRRFHAGTADCPDGLGEARQAATGPAKFHIAAPPQPCCRWPKHARDSPDYHR